MEHDDKIQKTDEEWERELTPEQYRIMREKQTEVPYSGKYVHTKDKGVYRCAACGAELFSSDTKFDSGTGWPSFAEVLGNDRVKTGHDTSSGMERVEVTCARCGAHLGHVFDDGPTETGKRYCINSVCLDLDTGEARKPDQSA
ncbi:MAG: peptide-methionine (R)-S-oxide reductase MsrB [bacterium]|nr:peptide-methionine (R)-S-oxide reductase MsrB [bacterium]